MTAREPSAVEVIAEALITHRSVRGKTQFDPDHCRTCHIPVMYRHGAEEVLAALKAAGFVVATRDEIRAMSPSEQAELIGGEVQPCSVNPECGHHVRIVREVRRELIDADVTRDHEEDER